MLKLIGLTDNRHRIVTKIVNRRENRTVIKKEAVKIVAKTKFPSIDWAGSTMRPFFLDQMAPI